MVDLTEYTKLKKQMDRWFPSYELISTHRINTDTHNQYVTICLRKK